MIKATKEKGASNMRHYLENKKFYVVNEEAKLVYEVGEYETHSGSDALYIHLELVAGWDYVNPDENDIQGWCPADRFIEEVQSEMVAQYFLVEGMREALEANDCTILENISPDLQAIIDKHHER